MKHSNKYHCTFIKRISWYRERIWRIFFVQSEKWRLLSKVLAVNGNGIWIWWFFFGDTTKWPSFFETIFYGREDSDCKKQLADWGMMYFFMNRGWGGDIIKKKKLTYGNGLKDFIYSFLNVSRSSVFIPCQKKSHY